MKKYVGIIVLCIGYLAGGQESVMISKGALTEGLFILQNKHLAVKDAIQELKKELIESSQEKSTVQALHVPSYHVYHAKLKQFLYPSYIDELGRLNALMEKDIALLNGPQQLPKQIFEEIIRRAFVVQKKIDAEKKLLSKIFEVDRKEYELFCLQQAHENFLKEDGGQNVFHLAATLAKAKEEVAGLRRTLVGINDELYIGDLKQQVFLNRLAFRRK